MWQAFRNCLGLQAQYTPLRERPPVHEQPRPVCFDMPAPNRSGGRDTVIKKSEIADKVDDPAGMRFRGIEAIVESCAPDAFVLKASQPSALLQIFAGMNEMVPVQDGFLYRIPVPRTPR